MMVLHSLLVTINAQTFQTTSNNPMHLYSPPPLVMSSIVVHYSAYRMYLSWNGNLVILTSLSHFSGYGSFYQVASHSHLFRCFAFMQ